MTANHTTAPRDGSQMTAGRDATRPETGSGSDDEGPVVLELRGLVARQGRVGTALNLVTFLVGVAVMYVTDLFVAL